MTFLVFRRDVGRRRTGPNELSNKRKGLTGIWRSRKRNEKSGGPLFNRMVYVEINSRARMKPDETIEASDADVRSHEIRSAVRMKNIVNNIVGLRISGRREKNTNGAKPSRIGTRTHGPGRLVTNMWCVESAVPAHKIRIMVAILHRVDKMGKVLGPDKMCLINGIYLRDRQSRGNKGKAAKQQQPNQFWDWSSCCQHT